MNRKEKLSMSQKVSRFRLRMNDSQWRRYGALMQVGFTMLEAGFCRSRETVNVLMECIVDTCLCGVLFFAIGFAFMFSHGNGWIGWGDGAGKNWFFLQDIPATYEVTGIAFLAY